MRKDNPIDKPITVSLFGTAASATLMLLLPLLIALPVFLFLTRMQSW